MHPAHQAFRAWLRQQKIVQMGQLWIQGTETFELRHELDRALPPRRLKTLRNPLAARHIALFTDAGKYRPLKTAPNLRQGWRLARLRFNELILALDYFYPAAVVHWHELRSHTLAVTHYRECARRQTGMYRITTKLNDAQVCRVAACACNDRECLKQPRWSVDEKGGPVLEKPKNTSHELAIPCPEPCSMLLSFARKVARLEQEQPTTTKFTKSDMELIGAVLRSVRDGTQNDFREGDFNDPRHRQRVDYFLRKHATLLLETKDSRTQAEE
jgi:hypothetical protein